MGNRPRVLRSLFDRFGRRSWAERQKEEDRAPREGFGPGQAGYAEYAFGRSALLDANALAQAREGTVSAVLLYRAAVALLGKAHELRLTPKEEGPRPWLTLPPVRGVLEALAPERRVRVERVLALPDGEATLATFEGADLQEALVDLHRLALELAYPLERAATRVKTREALRRFRRLLPWLMTIGIAAGFLWSLVARTNLAKHSAVTTTSAEPNVRANPRALVDGDRKNLGFHTRKGRGEAVTIDLGSIQPIQSVEVYNRYDCCRNRALPLRLEVGTDGITYETVARRTDSFASWMVPVTKPVRFLRLTNESTNFFHLSEVEVY